MKQILFSLLILLPTLQSNAAEWLKNQQIKHVYAGTVGERYGVTLVDAIPNPDSCHTTVNIVLEPIESNPKFKEMWSMVLTAYATGKPISFYLSGCSNVYVRATDIVLGEY